MKDTTPCGSESLHLGHRQRELAIRVSKYSWYKNCRKEGDEVAPEMSQGSGLPGWASSSDLASWRGVNTWTTQISKDSRPGE